MSSTVTVVTVSTVTTVALATSLSLIATVTLFLLLLKKEIIGSSNNPQMQRLSRALNAAIVPLFLVFVLTVITKLAEAL